MLTLLKKIFTWWNQDTFGTRIKTILFGKFVGKDSFGNKYYENKKGKRWVIYFDEIDASKIPVEWYSWIHYTPNKIEKKHNLEKYSWQKPHQENSRADKNPTQKIPGRTKTPSRKFDSGQNPHLIEYSPYSYINALL